MQSGNFDIYFPNADTVNYSDVEEVCGYQLLLCKIYECEGGFNIPATTTPTTREIRRQSKIWLCNAKSLLDSILDSGTTKGSAKLADVPHIVKAYDILHRIACGCPCHDYLREIRLRTADRWLRGDKSISRTDVVLLLLSEADRDMRTLEYRYAAFSIRVMNSWLDELLRKGRFADIPLSENYKRLAYLINTDLFVYMGKNEEARVKSQWVSTHLLTEEHLDWLDTETLWAYAHFIDSIPFTNQEEYERNSSLYMHILSKIASRPDTHPFTAKSIFLSSACDFYIEYTQKL